MGKDNKKSNLQDESLEKDSPNVMKQKDAQPLPPEKKYKLKRNIINGAIVFVLLIIGGISLWFYQARKLTDISTSVPSNSGDKVDSKPEPEKIVSFYLSSEELAKVKPVLAMVFDGEVVYPEPVTNQEVEGFYESIPLLVELNEDENESLYFDVESWPYIPGTKYKSTYESGKIEIDIDEVINEFAKLKPGKQIGTVISTGRIKSLGKREVNLKKIGNRNYAVYDSYFSPSGTWSRHYLLYDKTTKQLVLLSVNFDEIQHRKNKKINFVSYDEVSETDSDGIKTIYRVNIEYPQEIMALLQKIENLLADY